MAKNKEDYMKDLVLIAFRIDEKANLSKEKTNRLQRMANLARQGLKESKEFKNLEQEFKHPTVTDLGNEVRDLQSVVRKLKKYKWN